MKVFSLAVFKIHVFGFCQFDYNVSWWGLFGFILLSSNFLYLYIHFFKFGQFLAILKNKFKSFKLSFTFFLFASLIQFRKLFSDLPVCESVVETL